MSNPTPGPWSWEYHPDSGDAIALTAGDADVLVSPSDDGASWINVSEADARLIAAAPDLLDACRYAARACTFCEGQGVTSSQLGPMDCPQCDPIRKAIDKAEGRNPQS